MSQLSTKTAGIGRVSDVGKGSGVIVVNDMASVVAAMRHAIPTDFWAELKAAGLLHADAPCP